MKALDWIIIGFIVILIQFAVCGNTDLRDQQNTADSVKALR